MGIFWGLYPWLYSLWLCHPWCRYCPPDLLRSCFFLVCPLWAVQEHRDKKIGTKKTGRENPVPLVDDLKIRTYTVNRIAPGVPADEHGLEHHRHDFSHSRTS